MEIQAVEERKFYPIHSQRQFGEVGTLSHLATKKKLQLKFLYAVMHVAQKSSWNLIFETPNDSRSFVYEFMDGPLWNLRTYEVFKCSHPLGPEGFMESNR